MNTPLLAGDAIKVVKGNVARNVRAHMRGKVLETSELGFDYSGEVRVVLGFGERRLAFYARHRNRLSDMLVALNDGNPFHRIVITRN